MNQSYRLRLKQKPVIDLPVDFGQPICFLAGCEPSPVGWRTHLHKGIELGIVFSGAHETVSLGYSQLSRPGDTWLHGMWEQHSWRSLKPDTCVAVITFLPEAIDGAVLSSRVWREMLAAPPDQRPRPHSQQDRKRMLRLAWDLYEEIVEARPRGQTAKLLGLCRLLFELERWWVPSHPSASKTKRPLGDEYNEIMPALELVERGGGQRVTVQKAVNACRLSRSCFHLAFRGATGMSFSQYCMRARVGLVAHRLITTKDPLETIASDFDFVDASHLHRNFVKHCGCTPHHYRKEHIAPPKTRQILATASLMLGPDAWALEEAGYFGSALRKKTTK